MSNFLLFNRGIDLKMRKPLLYFFLKFTVHQRLIIKVRCNYRVKQNNLHKS